VTHYFYESTDRLSSQHRNPREIKAGTVYQPTYIRLSQNAIAQLAGGSWQRVEVMLLNTNPLLPAAGCKLFYGELILALEGGKNNSGE
jgi:hypothetical protein